MEKATTAAAFPVLGAGCASAGLCAPIDSIVCLDFLRQPYCFGFTIVNRNRLNLLANFFLIFSLRDRATLHLR